MINVGMLPLPSLLLNENYKYQIKNVYTPYIKLTYSGCIEYIIIFLQSQQ